jgi:hypothetical protein
MIHSAQVFSPQPSKDPRENLRILQSPLKNSFKSPVKATLQEEDEIILVQGSHPRVCQDERDLVILEDVALAPPSPKLHANIEPPRTPPRRRSLGGNTLHRAVLIRSAQRAVLKAEKEREEEEEEMEVLGAVVSADDRDEYEDYEIEDIEMGSPTEENEADYLDETDVADDGSTLVSSMTPQAKPGPIPLVNHATNVRPAFERYSLCGGEAKRVVVQQPWRVRDLVIPPVAATSSSAIRSSEKVADSPAMTVRNPNHLGDVASPSRARTPMRTPARPTLTEEERKAIQERRRSALKESGPFFLGGAPGLSPVKPKSSSSSSSNSPMKGLIIYEEDDEMKDKSGEEEEEDARSLLDRMKETVDDMRRRRSVASRITTPHAEGLSPRPLFAPVTPNLRRPLFQPELHEVVDSIEDESNEQEPFSLLRPGIRDEVVPPATLEVESSEEGSIPLPIVVVDGEGSAKSRDSQEIQEQPTRAKARLLRAPKSIDATAGPSEPNKEAVSLSPKHSPEFYDLTNYRTKNQKVKAKASPVKRSQKADPSIQDGEHVDSRDGGSLKAIATPGTAKRGRPRKVVQETLDQEESTPPVPVIAKASTKKKRTTPSGSNDSKVRGTRKAVAAIQNSGDDDEEKDKENTVSGDVEDWEQTQAQGVTVKVRVSRSRGAAGGERVEGTTAKTRTGSGRATRSASKAVKVEVVEEALVEPVRMKTRAKSKTG